MSKGTLWRILISHTTFYWSEWETEHIFSRSCDGTLKAKTGVNGVALWWKCVTACLFMKTPKTPNTRSIISIRAYSGAILSADTVDTHQQTDKNLTGWDTQIPHPKWAPFVLENGLRDVCFEITISMRYLQSCSLEKWRTRMVTSALCTEEFSRKLWSERTCHEVKSRLCLNFYITDIIWNHW